MNRDDFEKFVIQNYDASFDYPWKKSPENEVFRNKKSKKWFALVMNVQKKSVIVRRKTQIVGQDEFFV